MVLSVIITNHVAKDNQSLLMLLLTILSSELLYPHISDDRFYISKYYTKSNLQNMNLQKKNFFHEGPEVLFYNTNGFNSFNRI